MAILSHRKHFKSLQKITSTDIVLLCVTSQFFLRNKISQKVIDAIAIPGFAILQFSKIGFWIVLRFNCSVTSNNNLRGFFAAKSFYFSIANISKTSPALKLNLFVKDREKRSLKSKIK